MSLSSLSLVAAALMVLAGRGKKDRDEEEDKGAPPGSKCEVDVDCKAPGVCYESACILSAKDVAPPAQPEPAPPEQGEGGQP
jgi:hypothetical protein